MTAMDRTTAEVLAGRLKAVASPTRLLILSVIAAQPGVTGPELQEAAAVGQPTISYQVAILEEAGLVMRGETTRGRVTCHRLTPGGMRDLADAIRALS